MTLKGHSSYEKEGGETANKAEGLQGVFFEVCHEEELHQNVRRIVG
jgi:hypothetical protein